MLKLKVWRLCMENNNSNWEHGLTALIIEIKASNWLFLIAALNSELPKLMTRANAGLAEQPFACKSY